MVAPDAHTIIIGIIQDVTEEFLASTIEGADEFCGNT
jgi:hypothetical protein